MNTEARSQKSGFGMRRINAKSQRREGAEMGMNSTGLELVCVSSRASKAGKPDGVQRTSPDKSERVVVDDVSPYPQLAGGGEGGFDEGGKVFRWLMARVL